MPSGALSVGKQTCSSFAGATAAPSGTVVCTEAAAHATARIFALRKAPALTYGTDGCSAETGAPVDPSFGFRIAAGSSYPPGRTTHGLATSSLNRNDRRAENAEYDTGVLTQLMREKAIAAKKRERQSETNRLLAKRLESSCYSLSSPAPFFRMSSVFEAIPLNPATCSAEEFSATLRSIQRSLGSEQSTKVAVEASAAPAPLAPILSSAKEITSGKGRAGLTCTIARPESADRTSCAPDVSTGSGEPSTRLSGQRFALLALHGMLLVLTEATAHQLRAMDTMKSYLGTDTEHQTTTDGLTSKRVHAVDRYSNQLRRIAFRRQQLEHLLHQGEDDLRVKDSDAAALVNSVRDEVRRVEHEKEACIAQLLSPESNGKDARREGRDVPGTAKSAQMSAQCVPTTQKKPEALNVIASKGGSTVQADIDEFNATDLPLHMYLSPEEAFSAASKKTQPMLQLWEIRSPAHQEYLLPFLCRVLSLVPEPHEEQAVAQFTSWVVSNFSNASIVRQLLDTVIPHKDLVNVSRRIVRALEEGCDNVGRGRMCAASITQENPNDAVFIGGARPLPDITHILAQAVEEDRMEDFVYLALSPLVTFEPGRGNKSSLFVVFFAALACGLTAVLEKMVRCGVFHHSASHVLLFLNPNRTALEMEKTASLSTAAALWRWGGSLPTMQMARVVHNDKVEYQLAPLFTVKSSRERDTLEGQLSNVRESERARAYLPSLLHAAAWCLSQETCKANISLEAPLPALTENSSDGVHASIREGPIKGPNSASSRRNDDDVALAGRAPLFSDIATQEYFKRLPIAPLRCMVDPAFSSTVLRRLDALTYTILHFPGNDIADPGINGFSEQRDDAHLLLRADTPVWFHCEIGGGRIQTSAAPRTQMEAQRDEMVYIPESSDSQLVAYYEVHIPMDSLFCEWTGNGMGRATTPPTSPVHVGWCNGIPPADGCTPYILGEDAHSFGISLELIAITTGEKTDSQPPSQQKEEQGWAKEKETEEKEEDTVFFLKVNRHAEGPQLSGLRSSADATESGTASVVRYVMCKKGRQSAGKNSDWRVLTSRMKRRGLLLSIPTVQTCNGSDVDAQRLADLNDATSPCSPFVRVPRGREVVANSEMEIRDEQTLVIGCFLNVSTGHAWYTVNGANVNVNMQYSPVSRHRGTAQTQLFPAVSVRPHVHPTMGIGCCGAAKGTCTLSTTVRFAFDLDDIVGPLLTQHGQKAMHGNAEDKMLRRSCRPARSTVVADRFSLRSHGTKKKGPQGPGNDEEAPQMTCRNISGEPIIPSAVSVSLLVFLLDNTHKTGYMWHLLCNGAAEAERACWRANRLNADVELDAMLSVSSPSGGGSNHAGGSEEYGPEELLTCSPCQESCVLLPHGPLVTEGIESEAYSHVSSWRRFSVNAAQSESLGSIGRPVSARPARCSPLLAALLSRQQQIAFDIASSPFVTFDDAMGGQGAAEGFEEVSRGDETTFWMVEGFTFASLNSPFLLAAALGYTNVLRKLLDKVCEVGEWFRLMGVRYRRSNARCTGAESSDDDSEVKDDEGGHLAVSHSSAATLSDTIRVSARRKKENAPRKEVARYNPLHIALMANQYSAVRVVLDYIEAATKRRTKWCQEEFNGGHRDDALMPRCGALRPLLEKEDAVRLLGWPTPRGRSPMLLATRIRFLHTVERLMKLGSPPLWSDKVTGSNGVEVACAGGALSVTLALLRTGAYTSRLLNCPGTASALCWCARDPSLLPVVHQLLAAGADASIAMDGNLTPLHIAVAAGNHDMALAIIRHAVALFQKGQSCSSMATTALEDARRILCAVELRSSCSPLHLACESGDTVIVRALLDSGVTESRDLGAENSFRRTPLHLVLANGTAECALTLLAAMRGYMKREGNQTAVNVNTRDRNGDTPLHCAMRRSNAAFNRVIAYILLEFAPERVCRSAAVDCTAKNVDGNTLICTAIASMQPKNAETLLSLLSEEAQRAVVAQTDADKLLHLCLERGFFALALQLVSCVPIGSTTVTIREVIQSNQAEEGDEELIVGSEAPRYYSSHPRSGAENSENAGVGWGGGTGSGMTHAADEISDSDDAIGEMEPVKANKAAGSSVSNMSFAYAVLSRAEAVFGPVLADAPAELVDRDLDFLWQGERARFSGVNSARSAGTTPVPNTCLRCATPSSSAVNPRLPMEMTSVCRCETALPHDSAPQSATFRRVPTHQLDVAAVVNQLLKGYDPDELDFFFQIILNGTSRQKKSRLGERAVAKDKVDLTATEWLLPDLLQVANRTQPQPKQNPDPSDITTTEHLENRDPDIDVIPKGYNDTSHLTDVYAVFFCDELSSFLSSHCSINVEPFALSRMAAAARKELTAHTLLTDSQRTEILDMWKVHTPFIYRGTSESSTENDCFCDSNVRPSSVAERNVACKHVTAAKTRLTDGLLSDRGKAAAVLPVEVDSGTTITLHIFNAIRIHEPTRHGSAKVIIAIRHIVRAYQQLLGRGECSIPSPPLTTPPLSPSQGNNKESAWSPRTTLQSTHQLPPYLLVSPFGFTALQLCASLGLSEVCAFLIREGLQDPNAYIPRCAAAVSHRKFSHFHPCFRHLSFTLPPSSRWVLPIRHAVRRGDTETLKAILFPSETQKTCPPFSLTYFTGTQAEVLGTPFTPAWRKLPFSSASIASEAAEGSRLASWGISGSASVHSTQTFLRVTNAERVECRCTWPPQTSALMDAVRSGQAKAVALLLQSTSLAPTGPPPFSLTSPPPGAPPSYPCWSGDAYSIHHQHIEEAWQVALQMPNDDIACEFISAHPALLCHGTEGDSIMSGGNQAVYCLLLNPTLAFMESRQILSCQRAEHRHIARAYATTVVFQCADNHPLLIPRLFTTCGEHLEWDMTDPQTGDTVLTRVIDVARYAKNARKNPYHLSAPKWQRDGVAINDGVQSTTRHLGVDETRVLEVAMWLVRSHTSRALRYCKSDSGGASVYLSAARKDGETALRLAARVGCVPLIELLLNRGCTVTDSATTTQNPKRLPHERRIVSPDDEGGEAKVSTWKLLATCVYYNSQDMGTLKAITCQLGRAARRAFFRYVLPNTHPAVAVQLALGHPQDMEAACSSATAAHALWMSLLYVLAFQRQPIGASAEQRVEPGLCEWELRWFAKGVQREALTPDTAGQGWSGAVRENYKATSKPSSPIRSAAGVEMTAVELGNIFPFVTASNSLGTPAPTPVQNRRTVTDKQGASTFEGGTAASVAHELARTVQLAGMAPPAQLPSKRALAQLLPRILPRIPCAIVYVLLALVRHGARHALICTNASPAESPPPLLASAKRASQTKKASVSKKKNREDAGETHSTVSAALPCKPIVNTSGRGDGIKKRVALLTDVVEGLVNFIQQQAISWLSGTAVDTKGNPEATTTPHPVNSVGMVSAQSPAVHALPPLHTPTLAAGVSRGSLQRKAITIAGAKARNDSTLRLGSARRTTIGSHPLIRATIEVAVQLDDVEVIQLLQRVFFHSVGGKGGARDDRTLLAENAVVTTPVAVVSSSMRYLSQYGANFQLDATYSIGTENEKEAALPLLTLRAQSDRIQPLSSTLVDAATTDHRLIESTPSSLFFTPTLSTSVEVTRPGSSELQSLQISSSTQTSLMSKTVSWRSNGSFREKELELSVAPEDKCPSTLPVSPTGATGSHLLSDSHSSVMRMAPSGSKQDMCKIQSNHSELPHSLWLRLQSETLSAWDIRTAVQWGVGSDAIQLVEGSCEGTPLRLRNGQTALGAGKSTGEAEDKAAQDNVGTPFYVMADWCVHTFRLQRVELPSPRVLATLAYLLERRSPLSRGAVDIFLAGSLSRNTWLLPALSELGNFTGADGDALSRQCCFVEQTPSQTLQYLLMAKSTFASERLFKRKTRSRKVDSRAVAPWCPGVAVTMRYCTEAHGDSLLHVMVIHNQVDLVRYFLHVATAFFRALVLQLAQERGPSQNTEGLASKDADTVDNLEIDMDELGEISVAQYICWRNKHRLLPFDYAETPEMIAVLNEFGCVPQVVGQAEFEKVDRLRDRVSRVVGTTLGLTCAAESDTRVRGILDTAPVMAEGRTLRLKGRGSRDPREALGDVGVPGPRTRNVSIRSGSSGSGSCSPSARSDGKSTAGGVSGMRFKKPWEPVRLTAVSADFLRILDVDNTDIEQRLLVGSKGYGTAGKNAASARAWSSNTRQGMRGNAMARGVATSSQPPLRTRVEPPGKRQPGKLDVDDFTLLRNLAAAQQQARKHLLPKLLPLNVDASLLHSGILTAEALAAAAAKRRKKGLGEVSSPKSRTIKAKSTANVDPESMESKVLKLSTSDIRDIRSTVRQIEKLAILSVAARLSAPTTGTDGARSARAKSTGSQGSTTESSRNGTKTEKRGAVNIADLFDALESEGFAYEVYVNCSVCTEPLDDSKNSNSGDIHNQTSTKTNNTKGMDNRKRKRSSDSKSCEMDVRQLYAGDNEWIKNYLSQLLQQYPQRRQSSHQPPLQGIAVFVTLPPKQLARLLNLLPPLPCDCPQEEKGKEKAKAAVAQTDKTRTSADNDEGCGGTLRKSRSVGRLKEQTHEGLDGCGSEKNRDPASSVVDSDDAGWCARSETLEKLLGSRADALFGRHVENPVDCDLRRSVRSCSTAVTDIFFPQVLSRAGNVTEEKRALAKVKLSVERQTTALRRRFSLSKSWKIAKRLGLALAALYDGGK